MQLCCLALVLDLVIIAYCALRMRREMNLRLKAMSKRNRRLETQFFKALLAQSAFPFFLLALSTGPVLLLPLFDLKISIQSGFLFSLFSLYPPMDSIAMMTIITEYKTCARKTVTQVKRFFGCPTSLVTEDTGNSDSELGNEPGSSNFQLSTIDSYEELWQFRFITSIGATSNSKEIMNPSNEQSKYLFEQYGNELSQQLKPNASQYVFADLNGNSSKVKAQLVQKVDSEYLLRDLQNQSDENQNISRDAPNRPFLIGTPVNAKEIRAQLDSLDNAIVTPQIINGKVYFPTHTEADTRTKVEGSASNPNLNESHSSGAPAPRGVDLHKVKFTFAQLVKLLGQSTCQRLEREFVKQNQISEVKLSQLRTARESISLDSIRTAQSVEPNLLSTRTAQSVEPNLLSVYSALSPGTFTKNEGVLTGQSPEPNMLSTRTAQSVEPNLLSVNSARDLTTMSQLKARSPGVLTDQPLEPNLLSTRTARSSSSVSSLHGDSEPICTRTAAGRDGKRRSMRIDNCTITYRKFDLSESVHKDCTINVDEKGFRIRSKESKFEIYHEFLEFEESYFGETGRNELICKLMLYQPLSRENVYAVKIKIPIGKDKQAFASFVGGNNGDFLLLTFVKHFETFHELRNRNTCNTAIGNSGVLLDGIS